MKKTPHLIICLFLLGELLHSQTLNKEEIFYPQNITALVSLTAAQTTALEAAYTQRSQTYTESNAYLANQTYYHALVALLNDAQEKVIFTAMIKPNYLANKNKSDLHKIQALPESYTAGLAEQIIAFNTQLAYNNNRYFYDSDLKITKNKAIKAAKTALLTPKIAAAQALKQHLRSLKKKYPSLSPEQFQLWNHYHFYIHQTDAPTDKIQALTSSAAFVTLQQQIIAHELKKHTQGKKVQTLDSLSKVQLRQQLTETLFKDLQAQSTAQRPLQINTDVIHQHIAQLKKDKKATRGGRNSLSPELIALSHTLKKTYKNINKAELKLINQYHWAVQHKHKSQQTTLQQNPQFSKLLEKIATSETRKTLRKNKTLKTQDSPTKAAVHSQVHQHLQQVITAKINKAQPLVFTAQDLAVKELIQKTIAATQTPPQTFPSEINTLHKQLKKSCKKLSHLQWQLLKDYHHAIAQQQTQQAKKQTQTASFPTLLATLANCSTRKQLKTTKGIKKRDSLSQQRIYTQVLAVLQTKTQAAQYLKVDTQDLATTTDLVENKPKKTSPEAQAFLAKAQKAGISKTKAQQVAQLLQERNDQNKKKTKKQRKKQNSYSLIVPNSKKAKALAKKQFAQKMTELLTLKEYGLLFGESSQAQAKSKTQETLTNLTATNKLSKKKTKALYKLMYEYHLAHDLMRSYYSYDNKVLKQKRASLTYHFEKQYRAFANKYKLDIGTVAGADHRTFQWE